MKMHMRTPKTTNRAMMRALDQAYLEPPHWRASKRQTTAGMNTRVPGRSSCPSFCFQEWSLLICVPGALKKKKMKKMVTAPRGRLM